MNKICLENDLLQCRIVPEVGGAIFSFDCKVGEGQIQPLLRHTKNEDARDILDLASWPLVPFSNRIKHGVFSFEGKRYEIAKNYLGGPNGIHASHGQGWQFPWAIESASQTACALSFDFDPARDEMTGLWPFAYKARQEFVLSENILTQTLSVTNMGDAPMPTGLGTHPYFPKVAGTTLQAKVGALWEIDGEVIPVRSVPVPPEYDFETPKALDDARLDSCFSGYGGAMQIVWPKRPMTLKLTTSPELDHFVVYTPQGEDFFCAEPVSHKPNAINDADIGAGGLVVLQPGETLSVWYRYEVIKNHL